MLRLFRGANLVRSLVLFACWMISCSPNMTPTPALPAPTQQALATPTVAPPTETTTPSPTATATAAATDTDKVNTLNRSTTPERIDLSTVMPTPTITSAPTRLPATPTAIPISPTRTPTKRPPTPTLPPPVAFHATELVWIPAGTLRMGTPRGQQSDPDENPQHNVTVYAYSIEQYEVTNAQYQACVAAQACPPPTRVSSYTRPSYFGNPAFGNYPVLNVTWFGADAYCKWAGRRLPNEAEWERAARGVDNWRYTYTNILGMPFEWNAIYHGSPLSFCEVNCPLQNYWGAVNDGYADTAPIGTFGYDFSKGFGVQDMAGNVSEWTSNWYDPNAYTDGNDVNGPATPTGAKVYRGGSWADPPKRNADRESLAPNLSSDRVGFRCAQ